MESNDEQRINSVKTSGLIEDEDLIVNVINAFLEIQNTNHSRFAFIPAMSLTRIVNTRSEWPVSAKSLNTKITKLIKSGRLKGVRHKRTNQYRGYEINLQQFGRILSL